MNIFITNDDGIHRRGIRELASALALIPGARLFVFAPDRERTAAGHGITMRDSLYLEPWEEGDYPESCRAVVCSGTPADCAKIGITLLRKEGIQVDLVCSGINHGANLGTDVFYSGTVAAAMEGCLMGVPAIAFSLCAHDATYFEAFRDLVPRIVTRFSDLIPEDGILNVNVPNIPAHQLKGLQVTTMGIRRYEDDYRPTQTTGPGTHYEYIGRESRHPEAASVDIGAVQQGYVSLTPLSRERTHIAAYEAMKDREISWE